MKYPNDPKLLAKLAASRIREYLRPGTDMAKVEWALEWIIAGEAHQRRDDARTAADHPDIYPLSADEIAVALNGGSSPSLPKELTEEWTKVANGGTHVPGEISAWHAAWGCAWRAAIHRFRTAVAPPKE